MTDGQTEGDCGSKIDDGGGEVDEELEIESDGMVKARFARLFIGLEALDAPFAP